MAGGDGKGPIAGGAGAPGLQARVGWRSPAAHALSAVLAALDTRTAPVLAAAARPLAFARPLVSRVRPWAGWSPLSFDLAGAPWPAAAAPAGPPGVAREVTSPGAPPFAGLAAGSGARAPSHATAAARVGRASRGRAASAAPRREACPGLRLAVLRPGARPTRVAARVEALPGRREAESPRALLEAVLIEVDRPVLGAPLALVTVPAGRREQPGGFPAAAGGPAWMPPAEAGRRPSVPTAPVAAARALEPTPEVGTAAGLAERLAARDDGPIELSGLRLWPVAPGAPVGSGEAEAPAGPPPATWPVAPGAPVAPGEGEAPASAAATTAWPPGGEAGASAPATPARPREPAAPQPRLDVGALAEQVYQRLLRREQLERERRGLS